MSVRLEGAALVLIRRITIAAVAAVGFGLLSAPVAVADCFDNPASAECGGHDWNGPLRQTWDTPGYYGGNTGGNHLLCSPFTYECQGVSPAP